MQDETDPEEERTLLFRTWWSVVFVATAAAITGLTLTVGPFLVDSPWTVELVVPTVLTAVLTVIAVGVIGYIWRKPANRPHVVHAVRCGLVVAGGVAAFQLYSAIEQWWGFTDGRLPFRARVHDFFDLAPWAWCYVAAALGCPVLAAATKLLKGELVPRRWSGSVVVFTVMLVVWGKSFVTLLDGSSRELVPPGLLMAVAAVVAVVAWLFGCKVSDMVGVVAAMPAFVAAGVVILIPGVQVAVFYAASGTELSQRVVVALIVGGLLALVPRVGRLIQNPA